MFSEIVEIILLFQPFLLTVIVTGIGLEILLAAATRRFGWQNRNMVVYGFFFGLDRRQALWMAASLLWFLMVASSAVFLVEMEYAHLMMLLLLTACKIVSHSKRRMYLTVYLRDLFNSGLVFFALLLENLLHSYLRDTRFQWQIAVILAALALFVVVYSLYFLLRDMELLVSERRERREDQKRTDAGTNSDRNES